MREQPPFKWRHFQAEIILLCVRWYLRYALSYRESSRNDDRTRAERRSHHHLSLGAMLCAFVGEALSPASEGLQRLLAG
jgi:hypothetical protein